MDLQGKSTKELLALHNTIADTAAGPKTFAARAKLIARIEAIAAAKNIDLTGGQALVSAASAEAPDAPTLNPPPAEPKKRGLGVGELARVLLMDPVGYPHALIASMVNAQIPGATATDKSVRWYASKMRKDGIDVPARGKAFPADMDEKQSAEWVKTVRVVSIPGG